jgi:hypothetical protein
MPKINTLTSTFTAEKDDENSDIKNLLTKFKENIDNEVLKNIEATHQIKAYDEILADVSHKMLAQDSVLDDKDKEILELKRTIKNNQKQQKKLSKTNDKEINEFKDYLNGLDDGSYRKMLEKSVMKESSKYIKNLKNKYL